MKKLLLFLAMLFISINAHATAYTAPYASTVTGGYIYASQWNANQTQLEAFLNNQNLDGTTNIAVGGILTQNIADASVTDAKISGITTAGKVNGSAITGLNNIPSGAGQLPQANVAELTGAGNLVDGSALTDLAATPSGAGVLPIANGGTGGQSGLFSVTNYGTSFSSGTAIALTNLKIVYGQSTGIAGNSSQAITNLPFTNNTSYTCTCGQSSATTYNESPSIVVNSGSQATIYNNHGDNASGNGNCNWICIGS